MTALVLLKLSSRYDNDNNNGYHRRWREAKSQRKGKGAAKTTEMTMTETTMTEMTR